jgi:chromosome segregation ATPase
MRFVSILIMLVTLVGCERLGERGSTTSKADSILVLNSRLADMQMHADQQDSLMQDFVATTKMIEDIDKQLSQVQGLKPRVRLASAGGEAPADPRAEAREVLLGKVEDVTAMLEQSRRRVQSLSGNNTTLQRQITQYRETIASLEGMVERQRADVERLSVTVDSLRHVNTVITEERAAALDTVENLRRESNTVFYVIGTRRELMERGIIVEEGSKFLFMGRKTLVPARRLDPAQFVAIDKFETTELMLQNPNSRFRIVSRHDASMIVPDNGTGRLQIAAPREFWGASRYLIIVEG